MKTLTKILAGLSAIAVLANAGNFGTIGVASGLMDKQHVTVVNVSKTIFNYANLNANISNKTYKNYSVALNLFSFPAENIQEIGVTGIYGYEIYNVQTETTQTIQTQETDFQETTTKTITAKENVKKHQIYAGVSGTYIITRNLTLYNELDVGTRAVTLKFGLQHNITKNLGIGAEISKRWNYDSDYDNTNNVLFNISYTF